MKNIFNIISEIIQILESHATIPHDFSEYDHEILSKIKQLQVQIYNLPKVVCLCGSTRFKNEFFNVHKRLTLEGFITLPPAVFSKSGDVVNDDQQQNLFNLQLQKIEIADILFVVNVNGYIGDSTRKEIEFAIQHGKKVEYL